MQKQILILLLALFVSSSSFSQFDPVSNNTGQVFVPDAAIGLPIKSVSGKTITEIQCDSNYFWVMNYSGVLQQFTLKGDTIIDGKILDNTAPSYSLAISNNLNGGSFNPAFYTSSGNNYLVYYYHSDSGWTAVNATPPYKPYNCAGSGNYLYFQNNNFTTPPDYIMRYDGTSFNTLYAYDSVLIFTVADIAVDDSGYIYCFTGQSANNCLFIEVISPSGQLFKRFNFNLNTVSAYGCFLLHDTLYLGLGSSNPTYPNSLLPITFSADSAFKGVPVSMPVSNWTDLASCNAGVPLPLSVFETSLSREMIIYPNPAKEKLFIEASLGKGDCYLYILNIYGQELINQQITRYKTEVDISDLPAGIYIVQIVLEENVLYRKISVLRR